MPPSLGIPIQGPNFYSVDFSLWGLPHRLSVLTNFHPVPSVGSFRLDKKQKGPKQSAEWGSTHRTAGGEPWCGGQNRSGVAQPGRGGCSDCFSFNSNEPLQGPLGSWLLITKLSTNRNKSLWRNGWGGENTRRVWYILQRSKGSAQRITVTCQRRQKW